MEISMIEFAGEYLGGLDKAKAVTKWAIDNKNVFDKHIKGFDELINRLNAIPNDSPLLEVMPATRALKQILGGNPIPTLNEMTLLDFGNGLREARDPMLHGQKRKKGQLVGETTEDKAYAIGTPSLDTSLEALAVGTAGHIAERTFFQWARSRGLKPKVSDWHKDAWLSALDEGLMLKLYEGNPPHLTLFFIESNEKGGLNWLNQNKVYDFFNNIVSRYTQAAAFAS